MPRTAWTPEQRAEHSARMKAYWADPKHVPPRKGKHLTDLQKQRLSEAMKDRDEPLGICRRCGQALYDPVAAEKGIGDTCEQLEAEELQEGEYDEEDRMLDEEDE